MGCELAGKTSTKIALTTSFIACTAHYEAICTFSITIGSRLGNDASLTTTSNIAYTSHNAAPYPFSIQVDNKLSNDESLTTTPVTIRRHTHGRSLSRD